MGMIAVPFSLSWWNGPRVNWAFRTQWDGLFETSQKALKSSKLSKAFRWTSNIGWRKQRWTESSYWLVLAHTGRDVGPDSLNRKIMSIAVRESLLDLRIVDRQIMPGKGIGLVEVPDLIVDSQSPPNGIITRAALQENSFHWADGRNSCWLFRSQGCLSLPCQGC
jgi:hypothetical protein